ncbi:MarR family transcriptional regulator [Loktanella sp. IMCC34160]|uniref:MarR family winged helix-turn-helix transcriptional regulator n=1 Tax=Loktanella sp. IMCC34160 TaxID=2510646 RepID=UPI00101BC16A|nr:MarR family winged helix-turn-helix transcriptional regulator [Loktanella sp. IMCC34160]RYG91772.1 MarR family transcriptional regulator [Loktanella sp. IMCC34160]
MASLILEEFFPFQTRMFYRQVSSAVSRIYETRYGLKPYEWRTMAILGTDGEFTANDIVVKSSMDKVSVSRAISALKTRKWVLFKPNKLDGRSRLVRLSNAGARAYEDLVPLMLQIEEKLLSVYTKDEVTQLRNLMGKLSKQDGSKFTL